MASSFAMQRGFSGHSISPCELYTKKTMKDVFDAHKGEKITLEYNSQVVTQQKPLIYIGSRA